MVNAKKLQEQEIEELENEEYDFETLILQGAETTVPIMVNYPIYNGEEIEYVPLTAIIKPITNVDANNAYSKGLANSNKTTANIEIVKKGLFTKDMKPFKPELVEKMPTGVVDEICKQIMKISGISQNKEENMELVKKLMGF